MEVGAAIAIGAPHHRWRAGSGGLAVAIWCKRAGVGGGVVIAIGAPHHPSPPSPNPAGKKKKQGGHAS